MAVWQLVLCCGVISSVLAYAWITSSVETLVFGRSEK